jgi:hypothetical protein
MHGYGRPPTLKAVKSRPWVSHRKSAPSHETHSDPIRRRPEPLGDSAVRVHMVPLVLGGRW